MHRILRVALRRIVFVCALAATTGAQAEGRSHPIRGGQDMPDHASSEPSPIRAVRLIFEYEGDEVRLVSQQQVDMAVTGFDLARAQHPGVYVDARDADGRTLARVPARSAFAGSAEVFPEQPGEPIVRVDVPKPKGAFTVVVPAPQAAQQVAVVRVAPAKPDAQVPPGGATTRVLGAAEATDLATFPLELRP